MVPMLRRSLILSALVALIAAGSATAGSRTLKAAVCSGTCYAAPAGSGALLVFTGHGWGHGVGMSQYGAYGYALHGWTYKQILAHYYPGTKVGTTSSSTIRVLLADKKKTLKISSTVPFTVTDGTGTSHTLAADSATFGNGLALAVDGQTTVQNLTAPLTFTAGTGGSLTLGRAYRGQIEVDVVDGKLRAINIVGLEQYLYGVVPSEMPSTWSAEALKAQALAARSYALATRRIAAPYDVYSDTRSQMYLGIGQETATATSAVDATKGQVVLHGSKIATTFFFSTSGGETASSLDIWGTALPYLVPVSDPYDVLSPFHNWGPVPVTAAQLAKTLKLQGTITDATTTLNASGRVASIDVFSQQPYSPVPTKHAGVCVDGCRGARPSLDVVRHRAHVAVAAVDRHAGHVRLVRAAEREDPRPQRRRARAADRAGRVVQRRLDLTRIRRHDPAPRDARGDDRLSPGDIARRRRLRAHPRHAPPPGRDDVEHRRAGQ